MRVAIWKAPSQTTCQPCKDKWTSEWIRRPASSSKSCLNIEEREIDEEEGQIEIAKFQWFKIHFFHHQPEFLVATLRKPSRGSSSSTKLSSAQ
jgi:hypothetical protein